MICNSMGVGEESEAILDSVTAHGHPGSHGGLLSGWSPVLRSRSLVLVSGIHKGSTALALRFPLLCNVLFFRP